MPISVCIADDHLLTLGIRAALQSADDLQVVGVTHAASGVPALVARHRPDVVLVQQDLAGLDVVTCVKGIVGRFAATKVVMIAATEDPPQIKAALTAGASAYIGRRIDPSDLASVLRQVVTGAVHYRAAVHDADPRCAAERLTERERTLLEAVARGLTTKVISRELWISEKTVKFHLTNIYRKLGVHNRTGAMRYAFDHQLIAPQVTQGDTALSA